MADSSLADLAMQSVLTNSDPDRVMRWLNTFFTNLDPIKTRVYLANIAATISQNEKDRDIITRGINRKKRSRNINLHVSTRNGRTFFIIDNDVTASDMILIGKDCPLLPHYADGYLPKFPSPADIKQFLLNPAIVELSAFEIFPIESRNFWLRRESMRAYNQPISLTYSKWMSTGTTDLEICVSMPITKVRNRKVCSEKTQQIWKNVQIVEYRLAVNGEQTSSGVLCILLHTNMGNVTDDLIEGQKII